MTLDFPTANSPLVVVSVCSIIYNWSSHTHTMIRTSF